MQLPSILQSLIDLFGRCDHLWNMQGCRHLILMASVGREPVKCGSQMYASGHQAAMGCAECAVVLAKRLPAIAEAKPYPVCARARTLASSIPHFNVSEIIAAVDLEYASARKNLGIDGRSEQTGQASGIAVPVPSSTKLPSVKPWAMEAWQASQIGVPQKEIARMLAKKYGKRYGKISQPRVSEQIGLAQVHAEASALAAIARQVCVQEPSRAPARTFDPSLADQGKRRDGRSSHIRQKMKEISRDS